MGAEQAGATDARIFIAAHRESGISLRQVLKSTAKLGAGEAAAWLGTFALYAYIGRVYGAGLFGIVALSEVVARYVRAGTDLGLPLIGARAVAREPDGAGSLARPLTRKRLILCAVAVSLGVAYASLGPVPHAARPYVLGFALAMIPYPLSLDWLAWGLNHMGWLGGWRALVSILFAAGAVLAMHWTGTTLLPLAISRAASVAAGTLLLWGLWHFAWRHETAGPRDPAARGLSTQIRWGSVFALGGAYLCNLIFGSVDTLILGAMAPAAEVGRYNAAYKILFLVLNGYYLVARSFYPRLSASRDPEALRRWLLRALPVAAVAGSALAAASWFLSSQILALIYGRTLGSVPLLRILVLSLPMDFCTALVGVVLVSRGRDKLNLLATGLAAALNIGLNLLLIPKMQARGAAYATVLSYAFLLVILAVSVSRGGGLGTLPQPAPAGAAR